MSNAYLHIFSVHSVAGNDICSNGNMEGLYALIAAIKEMLSLCSLECASSLLECVTAGVRQCDSGPCHTML